MDTLRYLRRWRAYLATESESFDWRTLCAQQTLRSGDQERLVYMIDRYTCTIDDEIRRELEMLRLVGRSINYKP